MSIACRPTFSPASAQAYNNVLSHLIAYRSVSADSLEEHPHSIRHVKCAHPYLQFDPLVVAVHRLDFEVDAHRADEWVAEGVVCVAEQKGGLTHAAVADDEQFEHVVKILVRAIPLAVALVCFRHLGRGMERSDVKRQTDESELMILSLGSVKHAWLYMGPGGRAAMVKCTSICKL